MRPGSYPHLSSNKDQANGTGEASGVLAGAFGAITSTGSYAGLAQISGQASAVPPWSVNGHLGDSGRWERGLMMGLPSCQTDIEILQRPLVKAAQSDLHSVRDGFCQASGNQATSSATAYGATGSMQASAPIDQRWPESADVVGSTPAHPWAAGYAAASDSASALAAFQPPPVLAASHGQLPHPGIPAPPSAEMPPLPPLPSMPIEREGADSAPCPGGLMAAPQHAYPPQYFVAHIHHHQQPQCYEQQRYFEQCEPLFGQPQPLLPLHQPLPPPLHLQPHGVFPPMDEAQGHHQGYHQLPPGYRPQAPYPAMHAQEALPLQEHGMQPPEQAPPPQPVPRVEEAPRVVEASMLFRKPGRDLRPRQLVIILRGLPGSGKSHLAKAIRDVELINGAEPPRIHAIDSYFMAEVEKEVAPTSRDASSGRGRKPATEKVVEYVYEAEMEPAYNASMFKAFKKTVEEGRFNVIIVDAPNMLVTDFTNYWTTAKAVGYEVYVLQPLTTDVSLCTARNTHSRSRQEIDELARRWQACPPLFTQLDATDLLKADTLDDDEIEEVEMDAEDGVDVEAALADHAASTSPDCGVSKKRGRAGDQGGGEEQDADGSSSGKKEESQPQGTVGTVRTTVDLVRAPKGSEARGSEVKRARTGGDSPRDADAVPASRGGRARNALSGLMLAYGSRVKRVQWADEAEEMEMAKGFRIGGASTAVRKRTLVRGPGAGYNDGGPVLPAEEHDSDDENVEAKQRRHDMFKEHFLAHLKATSDLNKKLLSGQIAVKDED